MEKEFIPINLALRLKALGFKERVLTYYEDGKPKLHTAIEGWDFNSSFLNCVSRPTYSQAFRWFREKYGLVSAVLPFQDVEDNIKLCYYYCVVDLGECQDEDILCNESSLGTSDINFSSYEEAELACLIKLIEIVENKTK